MKNIKYFILLIIFIGLVIYLNSVGQKRNTEQNSNLKNGIFIEGVITKIKRSNNHSFGILSIDITHSNVNYFCSRLKEGSYPYKIIGKKGEIYLPIYIERKIGDKIKLISNEETIYYYGKLSNDEGDIYIITNPIDINFIKDNSELKK